ncbi:MAG: hypothetical protein Q8Q59_09520 [Luteolibacter sp.]|nr:hypothetical protein [Luteolibacter sp.]
MAEVYDRRTLSRLIKQLDEARRTARDLLLPWLISGEIEVA